MSSSGLNTYLIPGTRQLRAAPRQGRTRGCWWMAAGPGIATYYPVTMGRIMELPKLSESRPAKETSCFGASHTAVHAQPIHSAACLGPGACGEGLGTFCLVAGCSFTLKLGLQLRQDSGSKTRLQQCDIPTVCQNQPVDIPREADLGSAPVGVGHLCLCAVLRVQGGSSGHMQPQRLVPAELARYAWKADWLGLARFPLVFLWQRTYTIQNL